MSNQPCCPPANTTTTTTTSTSSTPCCPPATTTPAQPTTPSTPSTPCCPPATTNPPVTTPTYTVSYSANGGSGAPGSQTKTHNVTLKLSSTIPTRPGHTFTGWGISSSATSASYSSGGNYTGNADLRLFAVWKVDTYDVSYSANGGTGAPGNQSKTHGTTLTLSSTKPTRTGFTFEGWSTSSTATTASYQPGGSYTTNAKLDLFAVWKAATYNVSYNANGGTGAPGNQTKTHGVSLTLSNTKPTRTGHTFLGWSTCSSSTSPSHQPGSSYTVNAPLSLFAVWEADEVYATGIKIIITGGN